METKVLWSVLIKLYVPTVDAATSASETSALCGVRAAAAESRV